jgi:Uma2 family endonuclease
MEEHVSMAAVLSLPEQKVILKGVSWETYERLLAEHEESSGTHFTYDQGMLEIMVLSARHEEPNRTLALLVEVIAEEMGIDLRRLGSITCKREDLLKGFEPDSCFYIQHAETIDGKEDLDFPADPPPDLIIEIDITHPSLNRFPIFAAFGVPEVWRFNGERVLILQLERGQYVEIQQRLAFPLLTSEDATRFLESSKTLRSTAWLRSVRDWVRLQETPGSRQ